MSLRRPAFTELFDALEEFTPERQSVYVYGTTPEERSAHSAEWESRASDVTFVRLAGADRHSATFVEGHLEHALSLRDLAGLKAFWQQYSRRLTYLDITGLGHHVWAPLLRAALAVSRDVRVVYVEPTDYTQSGAPTEGEIFDLSERISGIAPIPGFASLALGDDDDFYLVTLLGFEGTRLSYLLENVQPLAGRIVPVVGVPGFRAEYPFYAYHGNKSPLRDSRAWTAVRYVTANCPFRLFYALEDLAQQLPSPIKVAPIGTKPHSVGAVLYAIDQQASVEIVYDHPIRTAKRTIGASRALVYHVAPLITRGP
ncbi:MAG: hypothetical protein M3340_07705 [Actinomycetota bacterium]|nr:hypothetical protein [Actinomycetota bacterium]